MRGGESLYQHFNFIKKGERCVKHFIVFQNCPFSSTVFEFFQIGGFDFSIKN